MAQESQPDRISSKIDLPNSLYSARAARLWLLEALGIAEVRSDVIEDAALVVSELVTNALRHARPLLGGVIILSLSVVPGGPDSLVRVQVTDGGGPTLPAARERPEIADPDAAPAHGRGLGIVSALAARWGVAVDPVGLTTVWVDLEPRSLQ